jgi:hypothetical protein
LPDNSNRDSELDIPIWQAESSIPARAIVDYPPEYCTFELKIGEDDVIGIFREFDIFRAILDKIENRSLDVPAFVEVRPSSTEGLGVFATKDCSPGDLILSERPLVSAISLVTVAA